MQIPATMPEQIEYIQNLDISYRTLHPTLIIENPVDLSSVTIPFSSLLNQYKDFMSNIITSVELDENEQDMYMYRPKMVSEELYGTTELWDQILLLNNAYSIIEFKPKVLKFYDPLRFKHYIDEIMVMESIVTNRNR